MRVYLITWIFLCVFQSANAEKAPIKFGKPEMAEMEMTVYEKDTSAPAVVICNYGYFDANQFQFTQIIRIKILKKEGLYRGTYSFQGIEKSLIKGKTFNLENGIILEEKLKNESVKRLRITEDEFAIQIAMPNVKVGSVLDIEISYQFIPYRWYFQEEIPVMKSELIMEESPYISFRKNQTGFIPLSSISNGHWIATDMPAFKSEPFMSSRNNFITKFDFDILNISFPGYFKGYTTSWEAVAKLLDGSAYFGEAFSTAMFLNSISSEIQAKYATPLEQMKAAYDYIKVVKWDETASLYTTNTSLSGAFNDKLGNSADINLMLVKLLDKLDLDVKPVVMSTRLNGAMPLIFPSLNRLNYVIAYVKLNGKDYFMDATDELIPFGLLPERCINYQGRALLKESALLVQINSDAANKSRAFFDLELNTSNELKGKLSYQFSDYGAYYFRSSYRESNSEEEYLKDYESENNGLTVESHTIDKLDSIYLPVKEDFLVTIENLVAEVGNSLYITPLLFEQIKENPFKSDKRLFPVDFPFLVDKSITIKYIIPMGYSVESMPKPISMKLPENTASVLYNIAVMGNAITVSYRFKINKQVFLMDEYENLKEFYNQIIVKQAEPIILKKG